MNRYRNAKIGIFCAVSMVVECFWNRTDFWIKWMENFEIRSQSRFHSSLCLVQAGSSLKTCPFKCLWAYLYTTYSTVIIISTVLLTVYSSLILLCPLPHNFCVLWSLWHVSIFESAERLPNKLPYGTTPPKNELCECEHTV